MPIPQIEFEDTIRMPPDELYNEYEMKVICRANISQYGNTARLEVFSENHRIAIYEGTPAIGVYGAVNPLPCPFDLDQMYRLVHQAEALFAAEIDSIDWDFLKEE